MASFLQAYDKLAASLFFCKGLFFDTLLNLADHLWAPITGLLKDNVEWMLQTSGCYRRGREGVLSDHLLLLKVNRNSSPCETNGLDSRQLHENHICTILNPRGRCFR